MRALGPRFLERFSPFIQKTETCWLWMAGKDAYGYGQIHRVGKGPIKVHRAAWILACGPIGSHQHVLHRCDIRNCVNPAHLFLGDQAANMKDAAAKGRLNVGRPNARRVSEEVIQAILDAPQFRGVAIQLARRFGVSKSYVAMLRRGLRKRTPLSQPALDVRRGLEPAQAGLLSSPDEIRQFADALGIGG